MVDLDLNFRGFDMTQPALDRRTFLAFGVAGGIGALGAFGACGTVPDRPIVLKPFAHSRTVSSFAEGLFFCEDAMPLPLRRLIEAELARTDVVPEAPPQERERAAFFAWLAVRNIAPRALRRAGYEALAMGCENQRDFAPGDAAAVAQHTIGREHRDCRVMPRRASLAYGASAHASTCAFYAGHEDIAVVVETGHYCARALLAGSFYDDEIDAAGATWTWNFAAMAINAALDSASGENAQHGLNLWTPV
jgi:hypothetical protein